MCGYGAVRLWCMWCVVQYGVIVVSMVCVVVVWCVVCVWYVVWLWWVCGMWCGVVVVCVWCDGPQPPGCSQDSTGPRPLAEKGTCFSLTLWA